MTERFGTEEAGDGARRQRSERQEQRRQAVQRRHQAQHLAQEAQQRVRRLGWQPGRPFVYLLALFFLTGSAGSAGIVLLLPPDGSRNQIAFLLASGSAVWGLVGLIVMITRRKAPARQGGFVAYDAMRQGLLIAGCLELNLATRMLGLWTPLIGILLVAVFALFEVVTLGRRPA
jgi:hypothetical protein